MLSCCWFFFPGCGAAISWQLGLVRALAGLQGSECDCLDVLCEPVGGADQAVSSESARNAIVGGKSGASMHGFGPCYVQVGPWEHLESAGFA